MNQKVNNILSMIAMCLIVLTVILFVLSLCIDYSSKKNIKDINSVMENKQEGSLAYIDITNLSKPFATSKETTDTYYFAYDGKYYYVIFMNEKQYEGIKDNKKIRLEGIATKTDDSIKKIVISYYNDLVNNDNNKIELLNYDSVFGAYHLDMTKKHTNKSIKFKKFSLMSALITLLTLIFMLINKKKNTI